MLKYLDCSNINYIFDFQLIVIFLTLKIKFYGKQFRKIRFASKKARTY
jgi:hypothetical protein